MRHRNLIKSQIIQAWNQSIEEDYCNRRITSEQCLQASFWSHLNHAVSRSRRIFIAPTFSMRTKGGIRRIVPDLVVCNTREVISVIEVKFCPGDHPRYKKAIENLAAIAEHRNQISVDLQQLHDKDKQLKNFSMSKHILFVWACVHAKNNSVGDDLYAADYDVLSNCFLELHASTQKNRKPQVSIRG